MISLSLYIYIYIYTVPIIWGCNKQTIILWPLIVDTLLINQHSRQENPPNFDNTYQTKIWWIFQLAVLLSQGSLYDTKPKQCTITKKHQNYHPFASSLIPPKWVPFRWTPCYTPPQTNMTMENQPFEDVSPIENGDFSLPCLRFACSVLGKLKKHIPQMVVSWWWIPW